MTKDEALDLALEALELSAVTVDSFGVQKKTQEAITAIKQALAAPTVGEPVAIADGTFNHNCPIGTPLYTTAAQRPFVGLTDEEIMGMYNEPRSDAEMIAFGREVEAELKEKNT